MRPIVPNYGLGLGMLPLGRHNVKIMMHINWLLNKDMVGYTGIYKLRELGAWILRVFLKSCFVGPRFLARDYPIPCHKIPLQGGLVFATMGMTSAKL